MSAEKLFGATGTMLAICMFLALIEVIDRNMGGAKIWVQPAFTAANCIVWGAYGVIRNDVFLKLSNGVGIIVSLLTVSSAFYFIPQG